MKTEVRCCASREGARQSLSPAPSLSPSPSLPLISLISLVLALFAAGAALAHEGHDHGDEPEPLVAVAPRAAASTELFDVVAVLERGGLRLYVDRAVTNEPVTTGTVEVEMGGKSVTAVAQADGSLRAEVSTIGAKLLPGRHAMTVTVDDGRDVDIVPLTLEVEPDAQQGAGDARRGPAPGSWTAALREWMPAALVASAVGVAAFLLGLRLRPSGGRRGQGPASLVLGAASLVGLLAAAGHSAPARAQVEAAQRLADGSLFVPKAAQRLLGVRTVAAAERDVTQTMTLQGRVLPDPNHLGHVQPSQPGRVEPGPRGIPLVGQTVRKGEVMAWLQPAIASIDRATQSSQLADLRLQLDLAERRHQRYQALAGSVAQREIDRAGAEVAALRERLQTMERAAVHREALVAPVSGVVTFGNAAPGQLVGPGDVVFEIATPGKVLIEVVTFEAAPLVPGTRASLVGHDVSLALVGSAPQLRHGARTMQFAPLEPAPALLVNQLVQVAATLPASARAFVLPRDAIVPAAAGIGTVFVKREPERFVKVSVAVRPIGGASFAVAPGESALRAGDLVVVSGAASLAQVR